MLRVHKAGFETGCQTGLEKLKTLRSNEKIAFLGVCYSSLYWLIVVCRQTFYEKFPRNNLRLLF